MLLRNGGRAVVRGSWPNIFGKNIIYGVQNGKEAVWITSTTGEYLYRAERKPGSPADFIEAFGHQLVRGGVLVPDLPTANKERLLEEAEAQFVEVGRKLNICEFQQFLTA